MPQRVACEYCGKSYQYSSWARRRHERGQQHARLVREHYAHYRGLESWIGEVKSCTIKKVNRKRPAAPKQADANAAAVSYHHTDVSGVRHIGLSATTELSSSQSAQGDAATAALSAVPTSFFSTVTSASIGSLPPSLLPTSPHTENVGGHGGVGLVAH
eukprot:jgi/Chlat1/4979/Chrsp32S04930